MHEQEIERTKQEMADAAEVLERADVRRRERAEREALARELRDARPRGRSGITRSQR